jgi:hypothetical protein
VARSASGAACPALRESPRRPQPGASPGLPSWAAPCGVEGECRALQLQLQLPGTARGSNCSCSAGWKRPSPVEDELGAAAAAKVRVVRRGAGGGVGGRRGKASLVQVLSWRRHRIVLQQVAIFAFKPSERRWARCECGPGQSRSTRAATRPDDLLSLRRISCSIVPFLLICGGRGALSEAPSSRATGRSSPGDAGRHHTPTGAQVLQGHSI